MKYLKYIKKYSIQTYFLFIVLCAYPLQIFAQPPEIGNLKNKTLQQLVADIFLVAGDYILTILVGLTILVFMYGLMKYMYKGQGSDTARTEGRKLMLWGVIGIFVITSTWALVAIFASFVGHNGVAIPQF
jgi:magnesium-transporting ATPase (P-type)